MTLADKITTFDFMSATQKADVMAYGYIEDVTDAVQQALDYIATGGRVRFIRGGYLVSDTLYPQNEIDIVGDGGSSVIKFIGSNRPCLKIGTSDDVFNYGNSVRNLIINLVQKDSDGIKFNAAVHAEAKNIVVTGLSTDFANRTNKAFDLDGRNVSGFYNALTNCRAEHCHEGFVSRTTGTHSVTQNRFDNCTVNGDFSSGDTSSRGYRFENAGESSVITGGCLENLGVGFYTNGVVGTFASGYGIRYEANQLDLQHNSTAPEGIVLLGSCTLDPAKTQINCGHDNNTIQYGYDGVVGGINLPVKAGQIVFPGSQQRKGTYIGQVFGFSASPIPISINYTVNLGAVVLDFPTISGQSNATSFYILGGPQAISPIAGTKVFTGVRLVDNGGAAFMAIGTIDNGGAISFSRGLDAGLQFTAGGTKQLQSCSVSYIQ